MAGFVAGLALCTSAAFASALIGPTLLALARQEAGGEAKGITVAGRPSRTGPTTIAATIFATLLAITCERATVTVHTDRRLVGAIPTRTAETDAAVQASA